MSMVWIWALPNCSNIYNNYFLSTKNKIMPKVCGQLVMGTKTNTPIKENGIMSVEKNQKLGKHNN